MNPLLQKMLHVYMDQAGEAGGAGGGDAPADRGDAVLPDDKKPDPAVKDDPNPLEDTAKKAEDDAVAAAAAAKPLDEEPARDDKGRFIPKSRFDEQVGKERERAEAALNRVNTLEAQLAELNKGVDAAKLEEEVVALEALLEGARRDGDEATIAQLLRDIRHKERQITLATSATTTARSTEATKEEIRFDMTVEKLETQYPALAPDHEDYDQDKVNDILGWQQVYLSRGMGASAAMEKAVEKIMKAGEVPAGKVEAEDPPKGLGGGAPKKADDRTAAAVGKAVDAAKAQPASTKDVGMDSDKAGGGLATNVHDLTAEALAALPESKKAELRGDFV